MTIEEFVTKYQQLHGEARVVLLALVNHEMGVVARGCYLGEGNTSDRSAEQLSACNEVIHRAASELLDEKRGHKYYDPEVFGDRLRAAAGTGVGVENGLAWALGRAVEIYESGSWVS